MRDALRQLRNTTFAQPKQSSDWLLVVAPQPCFPVYSPREGPTDADDGRPMMEAHWRWAVHPGRAEGIGAFNEDREPTLQDPDS